MPGRRSQPQNGFRLDRSNPFVSGLVGAFTPKSGQANAIGASAALLGDDGWGFTSPTFGIYWEASPTALISLSPTWTILVILNGAQGTLPNGASLYCERPNGTQIVKLIIGDSGNDKLGLVVRDLSSNIAYFSGNATGVRTGPGPRVLVGTRRASNDHRIYVNGASDASNSTNVNGSFAATDAEIGQDPQDSASNLTDASMPLVLLWDRGLTDDEIANISANPWQVYEAAPPSFALMEPDYGWNLSGTGPSSVPMLSAGPIGGGSVGFFDGATAGASGSPYTLVVDPASYTLTAAAETLTATRALSVDPQSYAVSAAAVNLAVGRVLNFSPQSYAVTTSAQTLTATRALNISPVSYSLTAAAVTLSVGRALSVDPASYSLTTSAETLSVGRALSFDPVSYSITPADITLTYTPVSGAYELVVDPASYTLTAANQTLSVGRALNFSPAAYTLTPAAVTLSVGRVLSVGTVSYSLTASPVTLTATRALSVDPVAYAVTAAPVTLEYGTTAKVLVVDPVAYVLTLPDVGLSVTSNLQLLGGGPGGKRRKGGTESYLQRLLSRPLDEYEPEQIDEIEEAVETAVKAAVVAPQIPDRQEVEDKFKAYGDAFTAAYVEIYLQMVAEKRQEQEDEEIMMALASLL